MATKKTVKAESTTTVKSDKDLYIVRATQAGVFFGEIEKKNDRSIVMRNVRKLWYWDGACAVEELAVNGVAKPSECKFTVWCDEIEVYDPAQIIKCTDKAVKSIKAVKVWSYND